MWSKIRDIISIERANKHKTQTKNNTRFLVQLIIVFYNASNTVLFHELWCDLIWFGQWGQHPAQTPADLLLRRVLNEGKQFLIGSKGNIVMQYDMQRWFCGFSRVGNFTEQTHLHRNSQQDGK